MPPRKVVRISLASALLAVCGLLLMPAPARGQVPPEFANSFAQLPSFSTDTFTVILRGDQTAVIPSQNAFDKLTNPFAYNWTMTPLVTVRLDGMGNTDVVYKGSAIAPGTTFPDPNVLPHFGLDNGVQPGSMFAPLPGFDGMTLAPGTSISVATVPEPGSMPLIGQRCLGIVDARDYRRARKRRPISMG